MVLPAQARCYEILRIPSAPLFVIDKRAEASPNLSMMGGALGIRLDVPYSMEIPHYSVTDFVQLE